MGSGAAWVLCLGLLLPQSEPREDVTIQWEGLNGLAPEAAQALLQEIETRLAQSEDPGLKRLSAQAERARRELKTQKDPGQECYDAKPYVATLHRRPIPQESSSWKEAFQGMRPWESSAQCFVRLRYHFGRNLGLVMRDALPMEETLWNYLNGYPPNADTLLAWLQFKFDHDSGFDAAALHFDHLYCDRDGGVFGEITLYDAMASGETIEMPDIDVLAYMQHVLRDKSHKAPLPATLHQELYDKVQAGFLPYYRHRTTVEAAAHLWLNPEAWIRPEHEAMRENLLLLIAHEQENVDKVREFLAKQKDRAGLMDGTLQISKKYPSWYRTKDQWVAERTATRWEVANITQSVLEEYGLARSAAKRPTP